MKDQVDNLADRGISDVVTINGLLDPIERAAAIEQVADGTANLLYIAPEMLRSKTIERLLLIRNVVRFVIDEALPPFSLGSTCMERQRCAAFRRGVYLLFRCY